MLAHDTTRAGTHLVGANTGLIVDKQRFILQHVDRRGELRPVIIFELTVTHFGLVNTPER